MKVLVIFTTQLKATLEIGQQTLSLDEGSTVHQAVEALASQDPEAFSRLVLDEEKNVLPSIVACVNDQHVDLRRGEALHDGDTLTLLSAISGG